jgi:hypothetical protein
MATSREWRTAKLLNRLQNWSHRGKGSEVNQSTHGRIESGRAKGRRMYGSRSLEKKNHVFGLRKTVYSRKNS